jgi:hypothetical protein
MLARSRRMRSSTDRRLCKIAHQASPPIKVARYPWDLSDDARSRAPSGKLQNYFFSMEMPLPPTVSSMPVVFCRSW